MALNATSVLVLELHRYKDTVRGGALVLALGGLRTLSGTTDATLDCAFVENALFTPTLVCEKSTE